MEDRKTFAIEITLFDALMTLPFQLTLGGKQIATLNDMGRENNPEKIVVDGYVGQKIRIEVSKQYLTLCEVKVWGK